MQSILNLQPNAAGIREACYADYKATRHRTETLCKPLAIEDYVIQGMASVSPPRWHLAHTTWFFEHFLLVPHLKAYKVYHPRFSYLFNSYYNTVGKFFPREQRGLLSRPTVAEIYRYRQHVDAAMDVLLEQLDSNTWNLLSPLLQLGVHHEQQHQELLLTDIKFNFAINPLRPLYHTRPEESLSNFVAPLQRWSSCSGGIRQIGFAGSRFAYDNETPRHDVLLRPFRIADRLITNAEFLAFIEAGGYARPELWLSDGWATVQLNRWNAPLYWEQIDGQWHCMTLHGMQIVNQHEPVCHVSYFEADAYARWCGKRLPTEAEWETIASQIKVEGNFCESERLHPEVCGLLGTGPAQLFGDVWEWTQSPYVPYPGFKPLAGSVGEYNGKFMCSQMVLRGGSCVSPSRHLRATYRNFFYPSERWQFTGIRLAEDSDG